MQNELLHIKVLLKRLGILLVLFSLCRLIFYIFNYDLFPSVTNLEFFKIMVIGLRYDIAAICMINAVFIIAHIIPNPWREKGFYQKILKYLFYGINGIFLVLEAGDFIYYEFAQERTSSHILGLSNDIFKLIPQFIRDFWYVIIICTIAFLVIDWFYRRTGLNEEQKEVETNYISQSFLAVLFVGLFFVGVRGGLQGNSISPRSASEYVKAEEISLVTNTTFTVLHSLINRKLEEVNYMTANELKKEFNIYHETNGAQELKKYRCSPKPNVVVLIMESFSREYVGYYNDGEGYTPFLDSLLQHSIVFTDAYANGKHSIDVLPSVAIGMPALMTDPIIASPYFHNKYKGIGHYLKPLGYTSLFFHGGNNGTLGFDRFAFAAGFDGYFGRKEYGNDKDFDGNWGIFDEPFLQFTAEQLNATAEPFSAVFFGLSSHHPFTIPQKYTGKFRKGELPIHEPVQYSDNALREFFKTASAMPWFENTMFIITSDHTGPIHKEDYKNRVGHYAIPLAIYIPGKELSEERHYTVQQTDILPTILEYAGYHGKYTGFGSNLLTKGEDKFSVNVMNNIYQIISNGYVLHFNGTKVVGLYDYHKDPMLLNNLASQGFPQERALEAKIKAIIQTHRHSLIHNQLVAQ